MKKVAGNDRRDKGRNEKGETPDERRKGKKTHERRLRKKRKKP